MAEYEPDGATLEAFLCSDAPVRGIRGPFGSGKTTACLMDFLDRSFEQRPAPDGVRRTRWAVVRSTYGELESTVLKDFEAWAPAAATRIRKSSRPIEAKIAAALEDQTIVQSEWLFFSLDRPEDVRKLLSMQLTGAWAAEARDLPWLLVDKLKDRCGRYPPIVQGGPSWSGLIMDTNPPDPEHWWYRLAELERPEGWEFYAQPSGRSAQAENLRWLPPGYYDQVMSGKGEQEVRVYVDGDYGYLQAGDRVYEDYQDLLHCGDEEIEPDPALELYLGLDFGWSAACEFIQRDALRRYAAIDELTSDRKTTKAFAEDVVAKLRSEYRGFRIAGIYGDPAGLATSPLVSDDQPRTHLDICRAANLPVQAAPSNDLRLRIEAVAQPLRTLIQGVPQLRVSRRCKVLRAGFNGRYRYTRRQSGGDDIRGREPLKNEWSHPHDAAQYALLGAGEGREVVKVEGRKAPPRAPARKRYGAWMRAG